MFWLGKTQSNPLRTLLCFSASAHNTHLGRISSSFQTIKTPPIFRHQLHCLPVTMAGNRLAFDPKSTVDRPSKWPRSRPLCFCSHTLATVFPRLTLDQSCSENSAQGSPISGSSRYLLDSEAQDPLSRFLCTWGSGVCILKSTHCR